MNHLVEYGIMKLRVCIAGRYRLAGPAFLTMKRVTLLLWCFLLFAGLAAASVIIKAVTLQEKQASEISKLVGNLSGESVCVDKEKFPACHDEQVIYRVAASSKPDVLTVTMDKLVNDKPETMGVLDFVYDAERQTLSSEFTRNNRHGIWEFIVKGDTIEGTLTTLPDKSLVRRVRVRKDK